MDEKFVGYVWDTKLEKQLSYDFQNDVDVIFENWIVETLEEFGCPVNFRNVLAIWEKIIMPAILDRIDTLSDRDIYEIT